jgi:UDP-2-acetamido-3-amino-2,3-dideoxy-glucuronate N-acetyltransferase
MPFFVHPTAVVDENVRIGDGARILHFSHLMPGCSIGDNSIIGQNVFIGSNVVVGNNVHIQNNVSVYEAVICEDDVFLGPSMVFTNVRNPRSAIPRKDRFEPTIVRKGASIGANAVIVCGSEIGTYSFIGAGAVVTKDVLPYALVLGNPARQVGWVSEYGHRLTFNEEGVATCRESRKRYQLLNGKVIPLPAAGS